MSSSSDILHFHFPTYGDSILCKMDALRKERRFCDIALLLGGLRGTTIQPLHFHGHRVVLAASSDFLRDQFLLHEGLAELNVGIVSNVEVGRRLLLSCYTGLLEVQNNLPPLCNWQNMADYSECYVLAYYDEIMAKHSFSMTGYKNSHIAKLV